MRRLLRVILLVLLVFLFLPYALTLLYSVGHPVSTLMISRFLSGLPVSRAWMDIDQMSPYLPRSVVAAEDARFCSHHGIDWQALNNVLENAEDGEVSRGGSTIT